MMRESSLKGHEDNKEATEQDRNTFPGLDGKQDVYDGSHTVKDVYGGQDSYGGRSRPLHCTECLLCMYLSFSGFRPKPPLFSFLFVQFGFKCPSEGT